MANGDIFSLEDALEVQRLTKVNGVMSARGLLQNPALYSGYEVTPLECVLDWIRLYTTIGGVPYDIFHRQLMMMLYPIHNRFEKKEFNNFRSVPAILDYLEMRGIDLGNLDNDLKFKLILQLLLFYLCSWFYFYLIIIFNYLLFILYLFNL